MIAPQTRATRYASYVMLGVGILGLVFTIPAYVAGATDSGTILLVCGIGGVLGFLLYKRITSRS